MIKVQNIYYMLAYAFQVLRGEEYVSCGTEDFENTAELLAAILEKGVAIQIKRGLEKSYVEKKEVCSVLRGKMDLAASLKQQTLYRGKIVCQYEECSVNTPMNQVLKTTIKVLVKSDISKERKKKLKKLLAYFVTVDEIKCERICWKFSFHRNNQTYEMLMNICQMIMEGLLPVEEDGMFRMQKFLDDQKMHRLYEKFILEYYRREHPNLHANPSQVMWQVDDGNRQMLPIMQTDITLTNGNKILMIDAKYYSHSMNVRYDTHKLHAENLYQIFTYVKNKEAELKNTPHEVAGILLYAKTDEAIVPDQTYYMSGNKISAKTLDLNLPFAEIKKQLDVLILE